MSGSSKSSDAVLVGALAKKLANSNASLTLTEQIGLSQFIGSWTLQGTDQTGFPAAPGGDVNGWNSLCRTNWFNGRFLTAEALRRQDTYFDYRSRLDAQALMPGVAYGLGLQASGINAMPYQGDDNRPPWTGGFSAATPITLLPGLAFDMIGRPILVSQPFPFRLEQLIALQKSNPRRVVGGGTEFAPCICLAPDPGGVTGGSAAPPPGPYLLIIEAAEHASGDAKVYGAVCSDNQPVTCQADAWCAGFGLSLVRFPVDVPRDNQTRSIWDLRGVLSAYFYDVFEHSLIKRWDPPFGTDDGFCIGAGSGRKDTGAVALAMVYLATDGSALWMDSWIPRRSIVATPGEDWHRTRFGAPPRAAAWARIHQFQCMLAESLIVQPIIQAQDTFNNWNLVGRGFRHIPPIGFLPINPAVAGTLTNTTKPATGNKALDAVLQSGGQLAGMVSGFVAAARQVGESYFKDTNVISYTVVALHDDDILEDLSKVFDKDPVQLDWAPVSNPYARMLFNSYSNKASGNTALTTLARLGELLPQYGLEDLVNRRIEIVKLIVPLQGMTRPHPVLGPVVADAQGQAQAWGAVPAGTTSAIDTFEMAGLRQKVGLDMLPRQFVVYVKTRLVLLDVIFTTLELLALVLRSVLRMPQAATPDPVVGRDEQAPPATYLTTQSIRLQWQATPSDQRTLAEAAMAHPSVQFAIARAVPLLQPDLAVASRATTFQAQVDAQDATLQDTVKDPVQRRQLAVDRVADSYAAVYPGYQFVQLLAATQAPADTEASVQAIGRGAGALSVLSSAPATTAEDASLQGGTPVFDSAAAAGLYAQMRAANAEKPISSLLPNVTTGVTVGDILKATPAQATVLLGGAQNYAQFRTLYATQTTTAVNAVKVVIGAPPAGVRAKLQSALTQSAGDLTRAVAATRGAPGNDAATQHYLEQAGVVAAALGPTRVSLLTPILTRTG